MSAILNAKNLTKIYDFITVLQVEHVEVYPGDVIALLGRSGAGKTTLLEMLYGKLTPAEGEVTYWGEDANAENNQQKQNMAFVPQVDDLLSGFSGNEHLDLFAEYREKWDSELAARLVKEWEIPMERPVKKLSVGQRQKLNILLALCCKADLLILDEPVASLDPISRRQFLQELIKVSAHENKAIIFSTHIVSDVERVANGVWLMNKGKLVHQGELDALKESMVRLSFSAELSDQVDLAGLIVHKKKEQSGRVILLVGNWSDETSAAMKTFADGSIFVEHLSLEDLFFELNT